MRHLQRSRTTEASSWIGNGRLSSILVCQHEIILFLGSGISILGDDPESRGEAQLRRRALEATPHPLRHVWMCPKAACAYWQSGMESG